MFLESQITGIWELDGTSAGREGNESADPGAAGSVSSKQMVEYRNHSRSGGVELAHGVEV